MKGKISTKGYKKDSPDRDEPYLTIPSGNITMFGVPYPVYGVDNLGNAQMMYPNQNYQFPGSYVTETPAPDGYHYMPDGSLMLDDEMRRGGPTKRRKTSKNIKSSINELFLRNYDVYGLPGRRVYDPKAKEGGEMKYFPFPPHLIGNPTAWYQTGGPTTLSGATATTYGSMFNVPPSSGELSEDELKALAHQMRGWGDGRGVPAYVKNYDPYQNPVGYLSSNQQKEIINYMDAGEWYDHLYQYLPNWGKYFNSGASTLPANSKLRKQQLGGELFDTDFDYMDEDYAEFKTGGIHIDPSKKGTFTAAATKHKMGVQEFASHVLANPDDFSPKMRKKANFAHIFGGRNYQSGGSYVENNVYDLSLEQINELKRLGYEIEILND